MAQIKPKANKNIVTVGRLKQIVAELEQKNFDINAVRKALGSENVDIDEQKLLAANQDKINRYSKMIANPKAYKPKK